jgi:hypothetical protein
VGLDATASSSRIETTLRQFLLRRRRHPEVAGGREEMITRAEQIQSSDFITVAGQDPLDGESADTERKQRLRIQEIP